MMVPLIAAWVITWAVAANTSKRWSWWLYPPLVLCMWLGNQRAVFAQWQDRSLEPAVAATLTTELRDLASAG